MGASQAPIRALHSAPRPSLEASHQADILQHRHCMKATFNNPITNSDDCDRNNESHQNRQLGRLVDDRGRSELFDDGQWFPAPPRGVQVVVTRDDSQPAGVSLRVERPSRCRGFTRPERVATKSFNRILALWRMDVPSPKGSVSKSRSRSFRALALRRAGSSITFSRRSPHWPGGFPITG